jgi:hypothetical protein
MTKLKRILAVIPALTVFAACSTVKTAPDTASRTTLSVDNQSFVDMTIYVLRGSERIRLGTASAASKSQFVIPPDIAETAMALRFIADPVGSNRPSISEEINTRPGDEIVMQIPPG